MHVFINQVLSSEIFTYGSWYFLVRVWVAEKTSVKDGTLYGVVFVNNINFIFFWNWGLQSPPSEPHPKVQVVNNPRNKEMK